MVIRLYLHPRTEVDHKLTSCVGTVQRIHGTRTIRYVAYSVSHFLTGRTAFAHIIGSLVSQKAFGVDIWTLDPDALTMSFKVSGPSS